MPPSGRRGGRTCRRNTVDEGGGPDRQGSGHDESLRGRRRPRHTEAGSQTEGEAATAVLLGTDLIPVRASVGPAPEAAFGAVGIVVAWETTPMEKGKDLRVREETDPAATFDDIKLLSSLPRQGVEVVVLGGVRIEGRDAGQTNRVTFRWRGIGGSVVLGHGNEECGVVVEDVGAGEKVGARSLHIFAYGEVKDMHGPASGTSFQLPSSAPQFPASPSPMSSASKPKISTRRARLFLGLVSRHCRAKQHCQYVGEQVEQPCRLQHGEMPPMWLFEEVYQGLSPDNDDEPINDLDVMLPLEGELELVTSATTSAIAEDDEPIDYLDMPPLEGELPEYVAYTAGKRHDRGFMAFDRRGTDTGHGVGQALAGRWPISLFFCYRGNPLCLLWLALGDHHVVILNISPSAEAYFINSVSCSQISLHVIENWGFRWAPGLNPDAEAIQCETQVGGGKNQESTYGREEMCETRVRKFVTLCQRLSLPTLTREQRNWPTPSQRLANAMASVGPTPVKRHEAAAMALAGCVNFARDLALTREGPRRLATSATTSAMAR
ncbi:hypothetical protein B0H16DRAFT_1481466 [Mycena metata]|uniref:Uncharacterized protein n=1 Tax=Mycena metata TaxID=1033252 RepID=A0AAD7GYC1_9AGAR|nr:hypothetical protein B0H16DRAFT_1481466 [Mycena metata]